MAEAERRLREALERLADGDPERLRELEREAESVAGNRSDASVALISRRRDTLLVGLVTMLIRDEDFWFSDWRDLLVAMAPFHDAATRLGFDPVPLFEEAADVGPVALWRTVRGFGPRDLTTGGWPRAGAGLDDPV